MPEEATNTNQDIYSKYLNNGFFEINNKDTAILLLHGYVQTSKIYRPFVEQLKEYGDLFVPTLKGHFESNIVDIKDYKELIQPNLDLYKILSEKYKSVIIIGYSLGGVISLYLASKIKPRKLILIATPINYNYEEFKISARYLIANLKNIKKNNQRPSITKYLEMYKLASLAKKQLNKINCDTLCIHGEKDDFALLNQSYYILSNISSINREFYLLKEINHYVLEHYDLVLPKIIEYITRK
jgi:esterase/lipase